jgi:uncharacterized membrane protein YozB (DUF420 family)
MTPLWIRNESTSAETRRAAGSGTPASATQARSFAASSARRATLAKRSPVSLGALFVLLYVLQTSLAGHRRFPGDDWLRTFFLAVLTTHTVLAVAVVPLVARTLQLALSERFAEHRRLVRITYPVWLYVALTGLFIYWMNNFVRPAP